MLLTRLTPHRGQGPAVVSHTHVQFDTADIGTHQYCMSDSRAALTPRLAHGQPSLEICVPSWHYSVMFVGASEASSVMELITRPS